MVLTTELVNPREHPSYPFPAPHAGDQGKKRKGRGGKGKKERRKERRKEGRKERKEE